MIFHFRSWLRGMMVRLSGKRRPRSTGRAVRPKDNQRLRVLRACE
jgi:hypothetical protein